MVWPGPVVPQVRAPQALRVLLLGGPDQRLRGRLLGPCGQRLGLSERGYLRLDDGEDVLAA